MCLTYICKYISDTFSNCMYNIEKYNIECEEKEKYEELLKENPYYLLGDNGNIDMY